MCRNITILRGLEPPATETEIRAAAEQYVRKVSGVAKPSAATEAAYVAAIEAVAAATTTLLTDLPDFTRRGYAAPGRARRHRPR